jgi:site-specific DNA-methyltransferase (adenine-specific)
VLNGEVTLAQANQVIRRRQKRRELETKAEAAQRSHKDGPAWQIRHADCLEILTSLTDKARLILADPPYNIGVDYGEGKAADRLDDTVYMVWVETWLDACRDLLTEDGSLWVLIGDEYAAEYAVTLKRLGMTIRSWIKWYETFGVNCATSFNRCSRHLFYCVKNPRRFVFNPDAVTRPSDRQTKYADKRAAPGGKLWDDVWGIVPPIPRLTGTAKERLPDFPTQLPLALVKPIVLCASDPGDLVIDPFSGSGTTGVAAVQHGRRFLGIERSEEFVRLSRLRLKGVDRE